jgi:ABC-type nitrate/sulfonate/bicarbonate transport system permease component
MTTPSATKPTEPAQLGQQRVKPRRRTVLSYINIEGCLFVIALIVVWQLLESAKVIRSNLFPSPWQIWSSGVNLARTGGIGGPLLHTILVTVVGWLIASAVGLLLGLLMGTFLPVWQYLMASIDVIRSIPAIVFVPVIALIFGISLKAEIIVIIYVSIWPVLLSTLAGVQQVGAGLRDSARMMHLSRAAYVWKIALPSAVPEILVGTRLGMALALTLSIVGELLINPAGLGYSLLQAQQTEQPRPMFVFVILIGILGFLLNALLVWLARLILPAGVTEAVLEQQAEAS